MVNRLLRLFTFWQVWLAVWITVCIVLFFSRGTGDADMYQNLMRGFSRAGYTHLVECFRTICPGHSGNYPPFYLVIFYGFTKFFSDTTSTLLLVKLMLFVFTGFTIGALVAFGRVYRVSWKKILWMTLTSAALMINTQGLGYIDVLVFPFFILAMIGYTKKHYGISGVFFGLSFLVKWQPIMLLPYIGIWIWRHDKRTALVRFLCGVGISIILVGVGTGTFRTGQLLAGLQGALQDPYVSAAPNLPLVGTVFFPSSIRPAYYYVPMGRGLPQIGDNAVSWMPFVYLGWKGLYWIWYAWVVYVSLRKKNIFWGMTMVVLGYFFLSSGVHENHLMLGVLCALLYAISSGSKRSMSLYCSVDLMSLFSMGIYFISFERSIPPIFIAGIPIYLLLGVIGSTWFIARGVRGFIDNDL